MEQDAIATLNSKGITKTQSRTGNRWLGFTSFHKIANPPLKAGLAIERS